MKKIITIFILSILLISVLHAAAYTQPKDTNLCEKTNLVFKLSDPTFTKQDDFTVVDIPEQTAYVMDEGKPMLPLISKTYAYPFGTIISDVHVNIDYEAYVVDSYIKPAPKPVVLQDDFLKDYTPATLDKSVYQSSTLYPNNPYDVNINIGLYNDEDSVIVTVKSYSRYSPADYTVELPTQIDIQIEYQPPEQQVTNNDEFDLVIITDESFTDDLQPLVDHKNAMGMRTRMETVQSIVSEYDGVADWEDVKLRIKDLKEYYNIKFVLLAGGHIGQTDEWYVPDFRSHNYDDNGYEGMDVTYSCDLYYADLYKYTPQGAAFDDWDTNDDGAYAEGPYYRFGGYDKPDFVPDVAVGRIPFRYSWEVPIVVDKIITYETSCDDSWFKKAVFCAGDTSPYERYGSGVIRGIYEGELTCDYHASFLEPLGFEIIKLYTSLGVRGVEDISSVISEGCGWVNMQMHANPATGGNHITDLEEFARFYHILVMDQFQNDDKLPFMINDGCHNAQFDVSMQEIIDHGGFSDIMFNWFEWIPTDASSWFLLKEGGGAIGVIGNTALGYGYLNEGYNQGLGGWIMPQFAHAYAEDGKEYMGTVWAQGITDYIHNFPVTTDIVDRKTIDERVLLGDPSLKLGGYGIATQDTDEDTEEPSINPPENTLGLVDRPDWQLGASWTYAINDIEFDFSEVEDRDILATISTGEISLTITEDSLSYYLASVETNNLEVFMDINFDMYNENKTPLVLTAKLVNASINGNISFDKENLGINSVDIILSGALDTATLLENIDFNVPPIVLQLIPEIPISVHLILDFDEPYVLIQYPFEVGDGWPLHEATLTIDGTIESPYFRLLMIVNKVARLFGMELIPQEIAQYLPIIDLSEMLTDFGIPTEMTLSELDEFWDAKPFVCKSEENVNVDAGSFTASNINFFFGAGEFFYAPEVQNMVRIRANLHRFIPIMDDISLDLIDYSLE